MKRLQSNGFSVRSLAALRSTLGWGSIATSSRRRFLALLAAGAIAGGTLAACGGGGTEPAASGSPGASPASSAASPAAGGKKELTLVSFAVTQAAYEKIVPLFVAKWKKERGEDIVINQSYGGSGSQTRAVIDGLEADIVALALAGDVSKIEKAKLIDPGWEKEAPNDAIITKSVAVIVTREGNPKGIKDWADLAKPGVQVITANPKTSGGAKWNFLALWQSVAEAKALDFVTKVFANAPILPKDAREATDVFLKQKQGDALINYENEVILAAQKGEKTTYIVPKTNISIDNPVAVVDANVAKHGTKEVAEAFVKFLFTPEAQQEFAKVGFRPVDAATAKATEKNFAPVEKLATINKDFGGWEAIDKKFFKDGAIFDKIQEQAGKK